MYSISIDILPARGIVSLAFFKKKFLIWICLFTTWTHYIYEIYLSSIKKKKNDDDDDEKKRSKSIRISESLIFNSKSIRISNL